MDDRYLKYFEKNPKCWSLEIFDSWSLNNIEHCQQGITHRVFYRYLNMILQESSSSKRKIKTVRQLISLKKVSNFVEVQVFQLGSTDSEGGFGYVPSLIELILWQETNRLYPG